MWLKNVSLFKLTRSRASSDWILSVSRMTKSHRNHPDPGETSGSAAANRTSSPAKEGGKSTSRTLTITPQYFNRLLKSTRSTRSLPERTCVVARSSFMTCPASQSSHWCLTSTRPQEVCSVTRQVLTDPSRRPLIMDSNCQADSVTLHRCPPSCHAPSSFTPLRLQIVPTTVVLLHVAPTSLRQHRQVSVLTFNNLMHQVQVSEMNLFTNKVNWKSHLRLEHTHLCVTCKFILWLKLSFVVS